MQGHDHRLISYYHFLTTVKEYLHADIWLYNLSVKRFLVLLPWREQYIREVEKGPGDESSNKSQMRVHKKKKDPMVSPKKPPNGWTAFVSEKLKEVSWIDLLWKFQYMLSEVISSFMLFYVICLIVLAFVAWKKNISEIMSSANVIITRNCQL